MPYYEDQNFDYDAGEFDPSIWYIGLKYSVDIDFETEFTQQEREGQWFYYFEAKDDPSVGDGQEVNNTLYGYCYTPGSRLGNYGSYLQSGYLMNRGNMIWEHNLLNFTATGCHEIDDPVLPDMVNVTFLLPDGSLKSFEMTNTTSTVYDDVANYT